MWSIFLINGFLLFGALEQVHSKSSLQFVFVTTRGGEHEPCNYPGGPLFTNLHINETQSHLTEAGRKTAYDLGQTLSKTYQKELEIKDWNENNYWSFAGNAMRNQEAAIILGGSLQNQQYGKEKQWTPKELSKVQFPSIDYYFKFLNPEKCPEFLNEVSKQMKPVVEKLRQQYKDSLTEVEKKYKEIDQSKLSHIWITYETVQRLKHAGKKPEWWTEKIESDLKAYSEKFLHEALTKTEKLTRLSGGPILSDILNDIQKIKKDKGQPHSNIKKGVSIFTASQSVLAAQLAAFSPQGTKLNKHDIGDEMFYPGIGATHVLELYKDGEKHWKVKMMYRNGEKDDFQTMILPGCKEKCPLDQFTKTLENFKLSKQDQENECKKK